MLIRKLLLAVFFTVTSLAALTPAERVSSDASVYIEGAPLSESLTSMRTLVGAIAGEGIWSIMAANLEQRSGINLLDAAKLEEMGINTRAIWGLALNVELEATGAPGKPEFVMIVPTANNAKFYDYLKAKVTESQMPVNKEIEPGKLHYFGSENDPGYLLRTDDALLIGNKLELIKAMRGKASRPLADAQFYAAMRSHLFARNQNKQPLAAFYLNPKLIISSLKVQSEMLRNLQKELNKGNESAPVLDDNSPYVAEIRDNLQSSGGALVANAERVSFYFSYKYKEGYLADTTKIYPKIIQVKTTPLASDTLAKNPMHYSLLKVNLMGAIGLFKSLSPVFTEKYDRAMAEMKTKLEIDFEQQILANFRGNFNFQVLNIPGEEKMKDFQAWELYGAFGIKEGTGNHWVKFLKAAEKMAKEAEAKKKQKTKFEFEESEEGKFVSIKGEEKIAGKRKPVTVVFLIRNDEVIVSNSKANALKATKGTGTALSERLTRVPYDAAQGVFFLDLQQIFKAVMKTKEGSGIKNYANMMEKLKHFAIISNIQGDFATAETTLQLRK